MRDPKTSELARDVDAHSLQRLVSGHGRTHLDLFSGIGGFSIAAEAAGWETIGFCEINENASKILAKHWPTVPNHGDIRNAIGIRANLVTGGFPCQPHSRAGKRKGTADDRWLWPAMRDVIKASGAAWVVGENVPGIVELALDQLLSDMEDIGYTCWTVNLPALAVDAKHRRERIWVVGYNSECDLVQGWPSDRPEGQEKSRTQQLSGHVFAPVWDAVSAARVWRAAHGLPDGVDAYRNIAIGNSIVPQVAHEILQTIKRTYANDR